MSDTSKREELIRAVQAVTWNASNYPEKAQPHILGQNVVPLTMKIVDAVEAVFREHTAPTGDERGEAERDEPCACGHPRVEHDYGAGECYLSGCKCRQWEAATDDHETLVEVMTAATFVDGERRLVGWGPIADAILAAGFRRTVQGEPSDAIEN